MILSRPRGGICFRVRHAADRAAGTRRQSRPGNAREPIGGVARRWLVLVSLVSDGERIAIATDFGQFRLFGVKQLGGLDREAFRLAEPRLYVLLRRREGRFAAWYSPRRRRPSGWSRTATPKVPRRTRLDTRRGNPFLVGDAIPIGEPTQPRRSIIAVRPLAWWFVRPTHRDTRWFSLNSATAATMASASWAESLAATPIPQGDGVLRRRGRWNGSGPGRQRGHRRAEHPRTTRVADRRRPRTRPAPPPSRFRRTGRRCSRSRRLWFERIRGRSRSSLYARVRGGSFTRGRPPHRVRSPVRPRSWVMCFLPLSDGFIHRHNVSARPNPDTLTAGPLWAVAAGPRMAVSHHAALHVRVPDEQWQQEADEVGLAQRRAVEPDRREHGARERPAALRAPLARL